MARPAGIAHETKVIRVRLERRSRQIARATPRSSPGAYAAHALRMRTAVFVRLIFWLWFGAAVFAGRFLVLQRLPPAAVPGMVFVLTAVLLAGYFGSSPLRDWVDAIDLRALVALHLTRFVGVYFIVLFRRGELPQDFAIPGGIGDIVVALGALAVIALPLAPSPRLRATVIWNVVGLVDLLLVVVTAIRLNLADAAQMRALTRLPLSLLPTFLVPLLIASHAVIFARANRAQPAH
jgi:hypothetical protein